MKKTTGNRPIKLIFFDLDGTIFRYEDGIRMPVKAGIRQAREAGAKCVINTGRARKMLPEVLIEADFDGIITSSGSRIEYGGEVLFSQYMPDETAVRLLKVQEETAFMLETEDAPYMTRKMAELQGRVNPTPDSQVLKFRGNRYLPEDSIGRYRMDIPVRKVCFMAENPAEAERIKALLGDGFFVVQEEQSGIIYGEAVSGNCGKGKAVHRLCRALGIGREETAAFGDGQNDLDMLEAAGIGIAMGNAPENVQAAAQRICPSIAENGVLFGLADLGLFQL